MVPIMRLRDVRYNADRQRGSAWILRTKSSIQCELGSMFHTKHCTPFSSVASTRFWPSCVGDFLPREPVPMRGRLRTAVEDRTHRIAEVRHAEDAQAVAVSRVHVGADGEVRSDDFRS